MGPVEYRERTPRYASTPEIEPRGHDFAPGTRDEKAGFHIRAPRAAGHRSPLVFTGHHDHQPAAALELPGPGRHEAAILQYLRKIEPGAPWVQDVRAR